MQVRFLSWEDPLEEGMATHSSILAWRIPTDRGAWRAIVHGVAQSRTQLRRLSSNADLGHRLSCLRIKRLVVITVRKTCPGTTAEVMASLVAQLVKNPPAMQETLG